VIVRATIGREDPGTVPVQSLRGQAKPPGFRLSRTTSARWRWRQSIRTLAREYRRHVTRESASAGDHLRHADTC
jgi:hypothetical protein